MTDGWGFDDPPMAPPPPAPAPSAPPPAPAAGFSPARKRWGGMLGGKRNEGDPPPAGVALTPAELAEIDPAGIVDSNAKIVYILLQAGGKGVTSQEAASNPLFMSPNMRSRQSDIRKIIARKHNCNGDSFFVGQREYNSASAAIIYKRWWINVDFTAEALAFVREHLRNV